MRQAIPNIAKSFRRTYATLREIMANTGTPRIYHLYGFGTPRSVNILARVVTSRALIKPSEDKTLWQNLRAAIRRYTGKPIPGVMVKVQLGALSHTIESDALGYVRTVMEFTGTPLNDHTLKYTILGEKYDVFHETNVFINDGRADFGIISDIDDTVLVSHSTTFMKKLRLMLFKNAFSRIPFPGVPDFYTALKKGKGENSDNPLFYVSSSEWNLLDLIRDFLDFHNIPRGVFLMNEKEINLLRVWKSGKTKHEHKHDKIDQLMDTFPDMDFILIGDSGQKDAYIYKKTAEDYPGRILAIYIRKISSGRKFEKVKSDMHRQKNDATDMLFLQKTSEAMVHARKKGFVS